MRMLRCKSCRFSTEGPRDQLFIYRTTVECNHCESIGNEDDMVEEISLCDICDKPLYVPDAPPVTRVTVSFDGGFSHVWIDAHRECVTEEAPKLLARAALLKGDR